MNWEGSRMTTLKIPKKTLAELAAPAPSGERYFQMGRLIFRCLGRPKAIGERDTATGGGAQLRRVGPHVISLGTGLFADVRARGWRWMLSTHPAFYRMHIYTVVYTFC